MLLDTPTGFRRGGSLTFRFLERFSSVCVVLSSVERRYGALSDNGAFIRDDLIKLATFSRFIVASEGLFSRDFTDKSSVADFVMVGDVIRNLSLGDDIGEHISRDGRLILDSCTCGIVSIPRCFESVDAVEPLSGDFLLSDGVDDLFRL